MNYILFFVLLLAQCPLWGELSSDTLTEQANAAYLAGEQATTLAERERNFNLAFHHYLTLEERAHPDQGSGRLYFALANSAYQVGAYPWAVLYGERALRLRPYDSAIQANLEKSKQALGLPPSPPPSIWQLFFFWHRKIPLPIRLQLVFVLSLVLFAVLSLAIWLEQANLTRTIFWVSVAWALMLGSVAYTRYVEPLEAVTIQAAVLYRDAGSRVPVMAAPLLPGSKVHVLQVIDEGKWLKVLTLGGSVGYLPSDVVQIL